MLRRSVFLSRTVRVLCPRSVTALCQSQRSPIQRDSECGTRLELASQLVAVSIALFSVSTLALTTSSCASKLSMESADAIKAEELYNDSTFDRHELLMTLKEMHATRPDDVGVIWRLTRVAYDVANLQVTSTDEKKALIYYARDIIKQGLDLTNDVAAVHNWYGIILSSIGDYEGSKVAIANSYVIKQHWETAVQLNPHNPTTYYLLGRWCLAIADLSWLERKAAAVLFGTPPESSYDEALEYLLKSEELAPKTWKKRSLLIAHVFEKKKDLAHAREWIDKTLAIPSNSEDDESVHLEAQSRLQELAIN